jgi:hypothetical protein
MHNGFRIPVPLLKRWLTSLRNQCVGFDGIQSMVISCYEKLSCVWIVGEPYLALGYEPVRMVEFEEVTPT